MDEADQKIKEINHKIKEANQFSARSGELCERKSQRMRRRPTKDEADQKIKETSVEEREGFRRQRVSGANQPPDCTGCKSGQFTYRECKVQSSHQSTQATRILEVT